MKLNRIKASNRGGLGHILPTPLISFPEFLSQIDERFSTKTVFKPLEPHDLSPLWFYARWMKIEIELLPKSWVTTTRRSQRNYINILFVIKSENNFLPTFSSLKHLCINRPTVFFIFCTIDDWKKKRVKPDIPVWERCFTHFICGSYFSYIEISVRDPRYTYINDAMKNNI